MSIDLLLRLLHIGSGFIALLLGIIPAVSTKGGRAHKRWGNAFFYSMLLCAITAIFSSYLSDSTFLLIIGFFTAYMLLAGKFILKRNPLHMRLIGVVGLFIAALLFIQSYKDGSINLVLLVFGIIQLAFAVYDITRKKISNAAAVRAHGGRVGGAYISAVTAFMVTNFQFMPEIMRWLLPTVIGTFLISYSLYRFAQKQKRGRSPSLN